MQNNYSVVLKKLNNIKDNKKNSFHKDKNNFSDEIRITEKLNNIPKLHKYFCSINKIIGNNVVVTGYFETLDQRRQRIIRNKGKIKRKSAIYYDFIFRRVLPKLPIFREIDNK